MKKYNFLILTDHSTHKKSDSFYFLINELLSHTICNKITIVSRGFGQNINFFTDPFNAKLYGQEVHHHIKYNDLENNQKIIEVNHSEYDIMLFRIDPPVATSFYKNIKTVMGNKIFINDPEGVLKTGSKEYLINFKNLTPQTTLCTTLDEVFSISNQKEVVIKPLNSYSGIGIMRIFKDSYFIENQQTNIKTITTHIQKLLNKDKKVLVMDYLKSVTKGDNRIIIVNGEIIGSVLRLPSSSSWICNTSQGSKTVISEVSKKEQDIINIINPKLKKEGIIIYGIDTLCDDTGERLLSEINTNNVGGFIQMQELYKQPIIKNTINSIIQYIEQCTSKV